MTADPKCAVWVKDLTRKFGNFVAVNSISFDVAKGSIYGFLGPNGAGKSTTIRMLCGILAPTSGQGTVAGYDIFTQAEEIKSHIGYMSQKFSLYEDLTVEENIDFYSGIYRVPEEKKEARKQYIVKMADLQEHLNTPTKILSGGWRQRLALGCAILHEPSILFLDEPTSGVDPINRRRFWSLIYDLAEKGVTVFVTTHYMDEAEYFDYIAFIYQGELIAQGSPQKLKTDIVHETVLNITCTAPQAAMDLLQKTSGIQEVALFGRGLHVVLDANSSLEQIKQILEKNNVQIDVIEKIQPSLEDVFVSLIEAKDKQQVPA